MKHKSEVFALCKQYKAYIKAHPRVRGFAKFLQNRDGEYRGDETLTSMRVWRVPQAPAAPDGERQWWWRNASGSGASGQHAM
jgi:hypothetical protein